MSASCCIQIRQELRRAAQVMQSHCLRHAHKWLAEHVLAVASGDDPEPEPLSLTRIRWSDGSDDASENDNDVYSYAIALVEAREFLRAAHALDSHHGDNIAKYPCRPLFLRSYALFMDGERRAEGARAEATADMPSAGVEPVNAQLASLRMQLAMRLEESAASDAQDVGSSMLHYIYGAVLMRLALETEGIAALTRAVNAWPYNWAAWMELADAIKERSQLEGLTLPNHFMTSMFRGHVLTELQANHDALRVYKPVALAFPRSSYVKAQVARCLYNLRQMTSASTLFEELATSDPYRIDDIDSYSNVLYVQGDRAALSALAHTALRLDRYRPESCCAIGNLYSLRGEREKAVLYFRRALRLRPTYHSAWTLMGHEYVELKNTAAAIECYRRAVDANPRDYRAWYGLGQTYELLMMHQYAAYYYRRATTLRPFDERVWVALGQVYQHMQRPRDAILCYQRAAELNDADGTALFKVAQMHIGLGEREQAARFYAEFVEEREAAGTAQTAEVSEALLFLARLALQEDRLEAAEAYAHRVMFMPFPSDVFEARNVIAAVHARQAKDGAGGVRAPVAARVLANSSAQSWTVDSQRSSTAPHSAAAPRSASSAVLSTPASFPPSAAARRGVASDTPLAFSIPRPAATRLSFGGDALAHATPGDDMDTED